MIPFEEHSLEAYQLLLRVEVGIRELIAQSYREQFGDAWRKRLPGDLLTKIRQSEKEESRPQFDFIKLGPLYYLTLGELIPILRQSHGKSCVERLGGSHFVDQLENILAPRNALAHSRSVSSIGLRCIRAVYSQLESCLTQEGLKSILANPDIGLRPEDTIKPLSHWLSSALSAMRDLAPKCPVDPIYQIAVNQYWWGDSPLAGFDCLLIEKAAQLITSYNTLPSGVGSAADRQRFVAAIRPCEALVDAISHLERVTV